MNVLVVIPNWVGDVVLATPALRAIRRWFPEGRMDYLLRPYVREVIAGTKWHEGEVLWEGTWATARKLRTNRYDVAVLLPNSFKSALVTWLGGCKRRVGYARDGRTLLLSDPVAPKRHGEPTDAALLRATKVTDFGAQPLNGLTAPYCDWPPAGPTVQRSRFAIRSVLDSYLDLVAAVGADISGPESRKLELATLPQDEEACEAFLQRCRIGPQSFALLNPGGAFGSSKLWPAERYAELAGRLRAKGLAVVVSFSPQERPLAEQIRQKCPQVTLLDDPARSIGTVKALVQRCTVMVTNDTGPRHFAIAFQRPVVTIFGPTHQAWTDTGYEREIKLQAPISCGPCQQKLCPLGTTECLQRVSVDIVEKAVEKLIS